MTEKLRTAFTAPAAPWSEEDLQALTRELENDVKCCSQWVADECRATLEKKRYQKKSVIYFTKCVQIFLNADLLDLAEKWLNKILERNPKSLHALNLMAKCKITQNLYKEAEDFLYRSLNIDPSNTPSKHMLARCKMAQNLYKEAYDLFADILKTESSNDTKTMGMMVDCCFNLKKYEEAEKWIKEKLELEPRSPYAQGMMSWCQYKQRNYQEAKKSLQKELDINPENRSALKMLAECEIWLGQREAAINTLLKLKHLSPENSEVQRLLETLSGDQITASEKGPVHGISQA